MRKLYLTYRNKEFLQPLAAEIGWTHNQAILDRCKDDQEREFYLRLTRRIGWTRRALIQQIENRTYEKTLLNQTNFAETVPASVRTQAQLAVKDSYTFDFLELEYALRESNKPIGVAAYRIVRELPRDLRGQLPAPEQVSMLLEGLEGA